MAKEGKSIDDVTHEEFNERIDTHSQALMDEDLAELTKSAEEERGPGRPITRG